MRARPAAGIQLDAASVAAARLTAQRLARREHADPAALVAWMGAIQAQDPAGARWAVAMRLSGRLVSEVDVERALAEGAIVRTHVMRWTWQLVTPADLHWMLPLVAPRLFARAGRRHRELGLDDLTFRRSRQAITRALRDGSHLTRGELGAALNDAGIATAAGRLSHLLGRAELEGLICSGAPRGKAATYALVEMRAAPPASRWPREQALAELARRYFRSRGPATLPDFAWWSGLPPADARAALASVASELARETFAGRETWRDPRAAKASPAAIADAHLIPPFDEYLVSYKDRSAVLDPAHARRLNAGGGMLSPAVVLGGRVVGVWRRTIARQQVAVTITLLEQLSRADRESIAAAAGRYARFLGLAPAISFVGNAGLSPRRSAPARSAPGPRSR